MSLDPWDYGLRILNMKLYSLSISHQTKYKKKSQRHQMINTKPSNSNNLSQLLFLQFYKFQAITIYLRLQRVIQGTLKNKNE